MNQKATFCSNWSILHSASVFFLLFFMNTAFAQTTIVSHDFDADNNGWTTGAEWTRDASSFTDFTTNHWHTTPFNNYNSNMEGCVTSPAIDLSNYTSMTVSFDFRYNTEASFDGVTFEYSISGGAWTTLGSVASGGTNWMDDADVGGITGTPDGWSGDNFSLLNTSHPLAGGTFVALQNGPMYLSFLNTQEYVPL